MINLILDYEAKAGRLPRPHDKRALKKSEIPILWRLHVIGQLDEKLHKKLLSMKDVQYNRKRFTLNNKMDFISNFPDTPTAGERRSRKRTRTL